MPSREIHNDAADDLQSQVEHIRKSLKNLANRKQVVIPIWNAATIPDTFPDGVEGLLVAGDDNIPYIWKDGAWVALSSPPVSGTVLLQEYSIAGPRIVANGEFVWNVAEDVTIDHIRVSAKPGPTGSGLTVRVNLNGSSIGTVTIAASGTVNTFIPSTTSFVVGDEVTVDVTAVGSTTPGSNLLVQWIGSYT